MGRRSDGREERGEQTRSALLMAANEAFSEHGFAGASVRDIARRADVHPALVTYHFGSKRKLFLRVIEEQVAGLQRRLLVAADRQDGQGAKDMLAVYLTYLGENPTFPNLVQRGLLDGDEKVVELLREHFTVLSNTVMGFRETSEPPQQIFLTVFGAAVVPFLYTRALSNLDPLTPENMAERRQHLERLLDILVTGA